MKIAARLRQFSPAGLAAACLMPWFVSSCSSMSGEGTEPAAAAPAAQADGYPNLNIPVTAAAPQLTAEERERLARELAATRARQGGGDASQAAAEGERLRRVARQHAEERLKEIEAAE